MEFFFLLTRWTFLHYFPISFTDFERRDLMFDVNLFIKDAMIRLFKNFLSFFMVQSSFSFQQSCSGSFGKERGYSCDVIQNIEKLDVLNSSRPRLC